MSIQDPIADMICRIKNAQARFRPEVAMPFSRHKESISALMRREGFIEDFRVEQQDQKKDLVVTLKYHQKKPVIEMIRRESKSSCRIYRKSKDLPKVLNGMGAAVISTSQGVMTDREARRKGLGGEVLFLLA